MDGSLIALAIVILGLIAFDVAALRFGVDSRSGKRELPTAGDLPPKCSQGKNYQNRWRRSRDAKPSIVVTQLLVLSENSSNGAQITRHVVTPAAGRNRGTGKPFKLPVSVEAHLYSHSDLAARGK